jgi:hypothetical protein
VHPDEPAKLVEGPEHFLEGQLEGYIIVSVPADVTAAAAHELREKLRDHFAHRRVIVITHNVQFARVERLAPKDAAKVVKQVEGVIYETDASEEPAANDNTADDVEGDHSAGD